MANPNLSRVTIPNDEVPLEKVTDPVGKLPEIIVDRAPVFKTGLTVNECYQICRI